MKQGIWVVVPSIAAAVVMLAAGMWYAANGPESGEFDGPNKRIITEIVEIGPPAERRRAFRPPRIWVSIEDCEVPVVRAEDRVYSHAQVGTRVQVDYRVGRSGRIYVIKVDLPTKDESAENNVPAGAGGFVDGEAGR